MSDETTGTRVFQEGDPWTREQARKGGKVSVEMRRRKARGTRPYEGTFLDVLDAAKQTGPSQRAWRVFWKAVDAIPMGEEELAIFRRHTDREKPPHRPVREAVMVMGRRSGKTINAGLRNLWMGLRFDPSALAPGEMAVIPLIAADRRQARQLLGYIRGFLELDEFSPFLLRDLKEAVELRNGVIIEVHTASYRSVRGYTTPAVGCDEIAFWRTDDLSANPDTEVLNALRPALATIPDSLLLMLSSPYAAKGELHAAVERYFGREDDRVLVWNADTRSMNPTVPAEVVERAHEEDPIAAASEWGSEGRVQFRRDVESFLDPEAVKSVTAWGTRELAPRAGVEYRAFVDPSGGSQDSMTLAIAHEDPDADLAVLDAVRETRAPFSPEGVVDDFAALLKSYGVTEVTGDRYAGEWPREAFARRGISYRPSERTKSDIYREIVAPVNSERVRLLDLPVLRAQLAGLERRTARGGRDSIDHGPGGRDDVANAAAGALGLVLGVGVPEGGRKLWYT